MLILNQEWSTRHWNVALEGTTLGSWEQCSGSRDLTPGFIPGQHETAGKHAGEVSWWQQKDYQREPSRILANPSWNFVRWPTRPSLSKFPLHCGRASACKVQTTNLFEKIEVIYKVPYIEAKAKHSPEHRLCQYQHPRSASSFLETTPLALDPGQFEKKNTRKQTQSFSLQQTHVHAQLRINLDCIDQDEKVYRCNSNCTRQLQPHAHSNGYSVVISCACSVSMGNSSQPRTRITSNFLCAWLFSRLWGWSTYSTHQRASLHHLQVHSHSSARVCACVCVCVCVCWLPIARSTAANLPACLTLVEWREQRIILLSSCISHSKSRFWCWSSRFWQNWFPDDDPGSCILIWSANMSSCSLVLYQSHNHRVYTLSHCIFPESHLIMGPTAGCRCILSAYMQPLGTRSLSLKCLSFTSQMWRGLEPKKWPKHPFRVCTFVSIPKKAHLTLSSFLMLSLKISLNLQFLLTNSGIQRETCMHLRNDNIWIDSVNLSESSKKSVTKHGHHSTQRGTRHIHKETDQV